MPYNLYGELNIYMPEFSTQLYIFIGFIVSIAVLLVCNRGFYRLLSSKPKAIDEQEILKYYAPDIGTDDIPEQFTEEDKENSPENHDPPASPHRTPTDAPVVNSNYKNRERQPSQAFSDNGNGSAPQPQNQKPNGSFRRVPTDAPVINPGYKSRERQPSQASSDNGYGSAPQPQNQKPAGSFHRVPTDAPVVNPGYKNTSRQPSQASDNNGSGNEPPTKIYLNPNP